MDGAELARWTRFAGKGGIGKCTATEDCVAENAEDLMFLKDDEIIVLMQLANPEDTYLGYCEGVVGRFLGSSVRFHAKLKKPVMAKRSSTMSMKSPTPSMMLDRRESISADKDDVRLLPVNSPSPMADSEMISSPAPGSFSRSFDTLNEMPEKLRLAVHSPSPENMSLPGDLQERLKLAMSSPSPEDEKLNLIDDDSCSAANTSIETIRELPTPQHHSTDDTLRGDDTQFEKTLASDMHPHARHHSTEDTLVAESSTRQSVDHYELTRSPSPIMQRIREELKANESLETSEHDKLDDEDSVVLAPLEDAGISIGLSLLQGSDDESEYSDSDDDDNNSAASVTVEATYQSNQEPTDLVQSQAADSPVSSPPTSPMSPGFSDKQSQYSNESKPRKSSDTYDPWGDIYDDYRYSVTTNGTKSTASVYSTRSTNQPFPSPLLHTRFGSSSSSSLDITIPPPPLPASDLPPEPTTPPLTIRKRVTPVVEGERQSLFLPHPGAPKPPPPSAPLPSAQELQYQPPTPTGGNLLPTIHQALNSRQPRPTIYGRTLEDLWDAIGPVGITFSVDPPPLPPPPSMFTPRTSSPLRVASNSPIPTSNAGSFPRRERPRSRSFADLKLGAGMQTQSVKESTPTIMPSRSMSQLGTDQALAEEHRVSRVHVPDPIPAVAPQRFGSFVPSQPVMSSPPSPTARNSPGPSNSRGMTSPLGPGHDNSSSSMSPTQRQRPSIDGPGPSNMNPIANFPSASQSLSQLTKIPESRMTTPPPQSPPPLSRMASPPPLNRKESGGFHGSGSSPSPPPVVIGGRSSVENSPSLGAMARALSPPPSSVLNGDVGRGSPSLGSILSTSSSMGSNSGKNSPSLNGSAFQPTSLALGRDSPILGAFQGHPVPSPSRLASPPNDPPNIDTTQPLLRPLNVAPGRKGSLTLLPPPPLNAPRVETPSPSPAASLSAFPLPPFATSAHHASSSSSTSNFLFPPPTSSPTPPLNASTTRKLSLPNLRARTLSHRAESVGGGMEAQPMRPSIDTESIRSGFSSSGVSVSVRSMEFEMITGQQSSDSPSSPLPRSSTNSFSTPPAPPPASLPPRDSTPAPQLRDREAKFLSTLSSTSGGNKAKKKKLKKLIQEGTSVPMSVRWLVWMEMVATPSTSLPAPGSSGAVGGGLGGGGPGGRNAEALRALLDGVDGEGWERLKQAYRRMCPDVGWGDELDAILPFLLALAPEQDAFWIFCCVMDTYLRAYYTRTGDENTPQLEIDGELLARSLAKADSALSHHLLTTLGIPAGTVARAIGIRGAFVGRVFEPGETDEGTRRVWDSWLCESEGLPCLVRTAMTLLIYPPRRKALLTTSDPEDAMQIMARPVHLPADDLIFRNAKWKINDEDLKRERGRMTKVLADASRKKAVASMGRGGAGRGISLPRA